MSTAHRRDVTCTVQAAQAARQLKFFNMRRVVVIGGLLLCGSVAQYVPTDCSQLTSCTTCASKPECGWLPECNICVAGGPNGPGNTTACLLRCDSYVYHPIMCSVSCVRSSPATTCLERPGCVYCSRAPGNPATFTASVPSSPSAYPAGFVIKYDMLGNLAGGCGPALPGTNGVGAVPDLRAIYDQMVLTGDDAVGSLDYHTFASYYTCSAPTVGSVADAGRSTARQSALALAQAQVCGPLASPGACTLQRGCGWCGNKCVAYALSKDGSSYDVGDPVACPNATLFNSMLILTDQPHKFDSFCAPLADKGCRTCAAAGCSYCHTTNLCHNSTAPTSVCPRMSYQGSTLNVLMVTNRDAARCDYFCNAANTASDCGLCLLSKHCNYCTPPQPNTFGFPASSYSGIPARSYGCRPVNGSLASDYSDAMSNAATVCGWQAQSGQLAASLTLSNGFTTAVTPQPPIAGGMGNGGRCPVSICSSLSASACLFSSYCILCGTSGGAPSTLRCLPATSSASGDCAATQSSGSSQIVYGGRGSVSFYMSTIQQIYPTFCNDLGAGAVGPAASACAMAMGVCGWCIDRQQCVFSSSGNSASPASGTCNATVPGTGVSNYIASRRSSGAVTSAMIARLPPPLTCESLTSEQMCLASPACGWCSGNGGTPGYPRCLAYDASNSPVGRCAGGFIYPGNRPGSLVASCLDLSNNCSTCLSAGLPNSGADVIVADGPCGYCASSSTCFPGSATGPAASYPSSTPTTYSAAGSYPLTCPGKAEGWRFGSDGMAQCAAPAASACMRFSTCETCAQANGLGCQWCLGNNNCIGGSATCPAGGSLSGLDSDPRQYYSISMCPTFCRTQSLPPAGTGNCSTCISFKQCGFCAATRVCLGGNASGPTDLDAGGCPTGSTSVVPAGAPAGSAPVPGWLYGFKPNPDVYPPLVPSSAFGFCPATCSMLTTCSACTGVPGCGWARSRTAPGGGTCIPGNTSFGPFTAGAVAPEDWMPDSCDGPCGVGICASGFSGCSDCTARWGCGFCYASGCLTCLPADPKNPAAGPVAGSCKSVWIGGSGSSSTAGSISGNGVSSSSCGALYNGGGTLAPANYSDFDPLVSACDRACLLGGFTLVYTADGDGSANGNGNITLTPFSRNIVAIPGCRCLSIVPRFSGLGFGTLTRWGGYYPVASLSTQPTPGNISFSLGLTSSYEVSGGLGSYKLYTSGSGFSSRVAYFWLRGCSATIASPVCYGTATFMALPGAQTTASYFDQCAAACARESFSVVFQPSASYTWQPFTPYLGTAVRVPAVPKPGVGANVDASCTCNAVGAGSASGCSAFPGSSSNTMSVLVRASSDPSALATGMGLGPGKAAATNPNDFVTRFAAYPSLAEGGYAPATLTGCSGATPLCKRQVDPVPMPLPAGVTPAPTPIPTPTPAAAAAGVVVSYGASVRATTVTYTGGVDDCTYACLLAGFSVVLDAASPGSVQLVPAAAAPLPTSACVCRTITGSTNGRTASGSFTAPATGTTYTFSAIVGQSDSLSLSLAAADGTPLGSATYDAAGCSNATSYFCGRVPVLPDGSSSSSISLGVIIGGAIAAVVVIAGAAALFVFVIKPAMAAKAVAKTSAAASKPIEHSNPMRSGV